MKIHRIVTLSYRILLTGGFLFLFILMLMHPAESLYYAFTGLTLWFQKMIPTLFPFMILSGIMVRMNLTQYFSVILSPLLKPLFRVDGQGAYCIIMGFLCGFPMGARVIADLYVRGKLSHREAEYLLAFCNNIGPIYFTGFVLPVLGMSSSLLLLFGMYGIPLCYGIFLRRLFLLKEKSSLHQIQGPKLPEICLPQNDSASSKDRKNLLSQLDDSIQTAIEGITKLGGYMILFNLLNLFPARCIPAGAPEWILPVCNVLLEITSGISRIGNTMPQLLLVLLPFGGLSCIAQTYSILKDTDLSIGKYCIHKCILTLLTAVFYGVLQILPIAQPLLQGI